MVLGTLFLRLLIIYDLTKRKNSFLKCCQKFFNYLPFFFISEDVGKAMMTLLLFGSTFIFFMYHRYHSSKKHRFSRQKIFDLALFKMLLLLFCLNFFCSSTATIFNKLLINECVNFDEIFLLRVYKIISTIFIGANKETFRLHTYKIFFKRRFIICPTTLI